MPEECNLLLAGGRGGGKSVAIHMLAIRHCEQYGFLAKVLIVRETYEALEQLENDFHSMCIDAYGDRVHRNKSEGSFTFPNGAVVRFAQLAEQKHYKKFQGKSFTLLIVDEYGEITNPKWIKLLVSNVRGPKAVKKRVIYAANPGGAQHGHLHFEYIAKAPAWTPFEKNGRYWVVCPSTWRDNPHIDQEEYLKNLKEACGNDEELFKAWDTGDWNIARGAYFAGALEESVHMLPNSRWPVQKLTSAWHPYVAMDWGAGAPCITYICAESPGVMGFPKGSLILCDELAICDKNDLNEGLRWPPSKLADAVKQICERWNCPPEGVGDDAYGIEDSLLLTLQEHGIYLNKPKKERIAGWSKMRNMLVAAKERKGKPGLWISERCKYFWETVPFLQRDESYPEDLVTDGPDHGADAARYGVMNLGRMAWSGGIACDY